MQGVDHYENFPVASWLCPKRLRAPIAAIYHFARTADDIADEGHAPADERLADLADYRHALTLALAGTPNPDGRWPQVFAPLACQAHAFELPEQPLHDLLDAFEQDVRYTAAGSRYQNMAELLDYCRRSANPVGRLLLHLYGVRDAASLQQSDAICSALQLANFWQDLSVDLRRQRHYLPQDRLQAHGVDATRLMHPTLGQDDTNAQRLVAELVLDTRTLMQQGAPLARRLPGRLGWELRLVVQGGWRILDKIQAQGHRSWLVRPRLHTHDAALMLWRALWMQK